MNDSLLNEFVTESREHLQNIEPQLLKLEQSHDDQETVNEIFRAIHSIKGASGFFEFNNLKELSHVMESSLVLVREGKTSVNSTLVDLLLCGVDRLKLIFEDIHESQGIAVDDLITDMNDFCVSDKNKKTSPEIKSQSKKTSTKDVENKKAGVKEHITESHTQFAKLKQQGQYSYHIHFDDKQKAQQTLEIVLSIGGIIAFYINDMYCDVKKLAKARKVNTVDVVFHSVIEKHLLIASLEVSESSLIELTPSENAENKSEVSEPITSEVNTPDVENKPAVKNNSDSTETIRVKVSLLNKLMNLAGEMVLIRNQLIRRLDGELSNANNLKAILQTLDHSTTDLQEHIMQTRMQPIGNLFQKFPRLIRDISKHLSKQIELDVTGEEVELDKTILEALSDPLNHLIRNCCDHGIESPQDRSAKGKPEKGVIKLKAFHESGQIVIQLSDDGKGINAELLKQKAIEKGVMSASEIEAKYGKDFLSMIFLPGLSTAGQVSDLSGRGVGMDVVKTNIEKLGGTINVESEPDKGTTFLLKLPLTLAIIPSLIVKTQGHRFAISQVNIVELLSIKANEINEKIEKIGSASVYRIRDKLLPLVRLSDVLDIERYYQSNGVSLPDRRETIADERKHEEHEEPLVEGRKETASDYFVVVLQLGTFQYGLIVDEILDLEEIVVKPLSVLLKDCICFNGATIMGDGKVAMILDASGIAKYAKMSFVEKEIKTLNEKEKDDSMVNLDVILLNNAEDEHFAIGLDAIQRLEKVDRSSIKSIGDQEYITYQNKGLNLLRLESLLPIKPLEEKDDLYMIIPKSKNQSIGILASNIVDTRNVSVSFQKAFSRDYKGVSGAGIIDEKLTVFLEPNELIHSLEN